MKYECHHDGLLIIYRKRGSSVFVTESEQGKPLWKRFRAVTVKPIRLFLVL